MMSDLDDFLAAALVRQVAADYALHNGDPTQRLALWATGFPVTLFDTGGPGHAGWNDVTRSCRLAASRFGACSSFHYDLVAADVSGDLAYTVGYEHCTVSVDGAPPTRTSLRVTHVYRRERGAWTIVHRHGDVAADDRNSSP
jgi:ketosteroid isomerase-like protein